MRLTDRAKKFQRRARPNIATDRSCYLPDGSVLISETES